MANGFRKGELVTYINDWDRKGTFSYTHAVVFSCGKKQMVLTDAVSGKELGRHFQPVIGIYNEQVPAATFPRLTDEKAEEICRNFGERFNAINKANYERCIANHVNNAGYCKAIQEDIDQLHEPRAINRTGK